MSNKPIDAEIKEHTLGAYNLAWLIAHWPAASDTKEGRELVKRWKHLHARYANLSLRYCYIVKHVQSLRLSPEGIKKSYEQLDAQFDELAPAIAALHADLENWEQRLEKAVVTVNEMREEIARENRPGRSRGIKL
jgi:chromosome segregation ATPase